jgi:hypothetical protein
MHRSPALARAADVSGHVRWSLRCWGGPAVTHVALVFARLTELAGAGTPQASRARQQHAGSSAAELRRVGAVLAPDRGLFQVRRAPCVQHKIETCECLPLLATARRHTLAWSHFDTEHLCGQSAGNVVYHRPIWLCLWSMTTAAI